MSGEEIATILNKHTEGCGSPPEIDFENVDYFSYFENEHGEQSIFICDRDQGVVKVYIADASWENPIELPLEDVQNNELSSEELKEGVFPDTTEKRWLRACKSAIERNMF